MLISQRRDSLPKQLPKGDSLQQQASESRGILKMNKMIVAEAFKDYPLLIQCLECNFQYMCWSVGNSRVQWFQRRREGATGGAVRRVPYHGVQQHGKNQHFPNPHPSLHSDRS